MKENQGPDLWIKEILMESFGLNFKVEKTLYSEKSPYQQIDIVKTLSHGNMLLNDGVIMLSERDEFVYHEMISHVPLFSHDNPQKVLIIGGGDGGTAREVLKHDVSRVVMVEIDKMVVDACREYLPGVSTALDDGRLELVFDDGVKYVEESEETFDVIIVDSTDPVGAAVPLFEKKFYKNVSELLSENGIMVTQAESPFYNADFQQSMLSNQRPYFKRLHLYLFNTLTYPGGLWSFGFASKGVHPLKNTHSRRTNRAKFVTKYYNRNIHQAAFMLPTFVAESLNEIIDDL